MNLILCGMMGVGKTTIGKALAKRLGYAWADSDDVIVQKYGEIPAIFEQHGEAFFRDVETETIKQLANADGLVLSTGGGVVLREENVAVLKCGGKIVYLRAKLDTLLSRLQADTNRPLLQSCNLQHRLQTLLNERAHAYESAADYVVDVDESAADYVVDVDEKTVEELVEEIIEKCR